MSTPLQDKLREVAEQHLNPLLERRKELAAELEQVEIEIDAAEKAIAAASGGPATAKKSGGKKRAQQKASAGRERVLEVATKQLKDAGGKLGREDLLAATKVQLKEEGYGLTGLMQRFNKLVDEEDRFAAKGNSVSLKASHK